MPKTRKHKTRKGVAARFKVTASGKILRRTQNRRHLRRKKSKKAIRSGRVPKQVTGTMAKKIRIMLGM